MGIKNSWSHMSQDAKLKKLLLIEGLCESLRSSLFEGDYRTWSQQRLGMFFSFRVVVVWWWWFVWLRWFFFPPKFQKELTFFFLFFFLFFFSLFLFPGAVMG